MELKLQGWCQILMVWFSRIIVRIPVLTHDNHRKMRTLFFGSHKMANYKKTAQRIAFKG